MNIKKHLKDVKIMNIEEKLGYVMLGYEKAIAALMDLDHKSETIQKLVNLIYQLQCGDSVVENDTSDTRKYFAENHIQQMSERKNDYLDMFSVEEYEYLLSALYSFGNN